MRCYVGQSRRQLHLTSGATDTEDHAHASPPSHRSRAACPPSPSPARPRPPSWPRPPAPARPTGSPCRPPTRRSPTGSRSARCAPTSARTWPASSTDAGHRAGRLGADPGRAADPGVQRQDPHGGQRAGGVRPDPHASPPSVMTGSTARRIVLVGGGDPSLSRPPARLDGPHGRRGLAGQGRHPGPRRRSTTRCSRRRRSAYGWKSAYTIRGRLPGARARRRPAPPVGHLAGRRRRLRPQAGEVGPGGPPRRPRRAAGDLDRARRERTASTSATQVATACCRTATTTSPRACTGWSPCRPASRPPGPAPRPRRRPRWPGSGSRWPPACTTAAGCPGGTGWPPSTLVAVLAQGASTAQHPNLLGLQQRRRSPSPGSAARWRRTTCATSPTRPGARPG